MSEPPAEPGRSGVAAGPRAADGGIVVIGVGNEFRRDDGVGPQVLANLRTQVADFVRLVRSDGEPARLIEAWTGASLAVVVDAVQGAAATAGLTHRIVVDQAENEAEQVRAVSSHGLGLGAAIGLAQAVDLMPHRLVVHAIEAVEFGFGVGLTPAIADAVEAVTAAILLDLAQACA
jgi:hydrogenase maturation protease